MPRLQDLVAARGTRTVVFESWGYRYGYDYVYPVDSYARMQERLQYAALTLRAALGSGLAPVGSAFSLALTADPYIGLWQPDTDHPTRAGSYLTAAVCYDILSGHDASASRYVAGLSPSLASWLRDVARRAVREGEPGGPGSVRLPAIRDDPWSGSNGHP
jgi:hypothetical protein